MSQALPQRDISLPSGAPTSLELEKHVQYVLRFAADHDSPEAIMTEHLRMSGESLAPMLRVEEGMCDQYRRQLLRVCVCVYVRDEGDDDLDGKHDLMMTMYDLEMMMLMTNMT